MHVGIGNGTFASATKFTVGGEEAGTFDVSDLNGDGLPDLVATAFVSIPPGSTLSVLLHRPGLPLAPAIGGGSGGDHTATISWTAPPSNNTYPITGYIVTAVAFEPPSETITFNSTATTQTITGLTNGEYYQFRVQAINKIGPGQRSAPTPPILVG